MSHKPGHIEGMPDLAATWDALHQQALSQNVDPESQPIVVKDESQRAALQALAAVGGATVTDTPDGINVKLAFDENEEEHEGTEHATAAAKPHTFAGQPVQN